ncbi:hypothetical protein [Paenibacillus aestuarii]|uniref:DUF4304 domain-containing protein n=1 Tax=Paenibacillus aestuarii TaxID=516965 RepID=A0ABW0K2F5_9BACL|nr:hypothetical protein [Paenibacillus aestuarii]
MIVEQGLQLLEFLKGVPGFVPYKTKLKDTSKDWYTLRSGRGVVWGGKKWGVMHLEKSRLFFAIDYPHGAFNSEEIRNRLDLPLRDKFTDQSGLRFGTGPNFETVQIALYPELLNSYNVTNKKFTDFLVEVFRKSSR